MKLIKNYFIAFCLISLIPRCKENIDLKFIEEREWISESGNIIRFDDGSEKLKSDTIYQDNKPIAVIKSLDKKYNQMEIWSITKNRSIEYTSTEEFIK